VARNPRENIVLSIVPERTRKKMGEIERKRNLLMLKKKQGVGINDKVQKVRCSKSG
jgi:hypothetical protein